MQSFSWNKPWFYDPVIQKMSDAAQEFRFFLNAIAFSIILFVIFLRRSMKERERQRELASKWKSLNDKIKAARSILIMRQLAKKKRYQKEIRTKWPKLSSVSLFISNTSSTESDESVKRVIPIIWSALGQTAWSSRVSSFAFRSNLTRANSRQARVQRTWSYLVTFVQSMAIVWPSQTTV